jgi:hypothetical protein
MSISAITSSSAATQLNPLNSVSKHSRADGNAAPTGAPPRPPRGGGFIEAIASALQQIGVDDASSGATASTTATSTDGSTDSASADGGNVAQALGSFLQSLMGALHQQGGDKGGPPPYGEGPQGGGPGKLGADVQSLISKLSSGGTDSADGATDDLESSFKNLLDKLSGGSTDSTDANTKLASFLQALSNNLQASGGSSSGNLINTTV